MAAPKRGRPKPKKRSLGPRIARKFDTKFVGEEPEEGSDLSSKMDLTQATNWYNYMKDESDAIAYAKARLVTVGDAEGVRIIDEIQPRFFAGAQQMGWYGRMLDRGCVLPSFAIQRFDMVRRDLPSRLAKQRSVLSDESSARNGTPRHEPMWHKAVDVVDAWLGDGSHPDQHDPKVLWATVCVNMHDSRTATKADESSLADHYMPMIAVFEALCSKTVREHEKSRNRWERAVKKMDKLTAEEDEILAALEDDPTPAKRTRLEAKLCALDADIEAAMAECSRLDTAENQADEAHSGMDDSARRRAMAYVVSLATPPVVERIRKPRAPRPPKPVDPVKNSKDVVFMERCDELGIDSVNPRDAVGARFVWAYSTKYKILSLWEAEPGGFKWSGSKLKDAKSSKCKTVRKPEEFVESVRTGNPNRRRLLFDGLKTKERESAARLNADSIILAVEK